MDGLECVCFFLSFVEKRVGEQMWIMGDRWAVAFVCRTCLGFGNHSGADDLDQLDVVITPDETDSELSEEHIHLSLFSLEFY